MKHFNPITILFIILITIYLLGCSSGNQHTRQAWPFAEVHVQPVSGTEFIVDRDNNIRMMPIKRSGITYGMGYHYHPDNYSVGQPTYWFNQWKDTSRLDFYHKNY